MAQLEEITKDATVKGILANAAVRIIDAKPIGSNALKVVYESPDGTTDQEILYRDREPTLEVVESGRPWSFTGDGNLFRLVSEAQRIQLAYLFDPVLAVHTSLVEPLPHHITAVYEEMLTRQPLRFLLADDPGAGTAGTEPTEPVKAAPKRFYGTVTLDATRLGRDAGRINEEVLSHLASLQGAKAEVTLDIEVKIPEGAPDNVVRTVTENCRTLKFDSQGFKEE